MLLAHVVCQACFSMFYHITLVLTTEESSVMTKAVFCLIQHLEIVALKFNQAVRAEFSKDIFI
jgi:hypothetical protein